MRKFLGQWLLGLYALLRPSKTNRYYDRTANSLRRLYVAGGLLTSSLVFGVIGYMTLEAYPFLDALFMTVITISTVGFSEVRGLSNTGKIFTSVFIIYNVTILAYVVSVLTTYIFEGELKTILRTFMTGRQISKIKNHTIVCGYGRNGKRACQELHAEKSPFVLVETDHKVLEQLRETTDYMYIEGDATNEEVLVAAGISHAKALITTLPRDAENVFIALTARTLNPKAKIIARATDEKAEHKLQLAGADAVVMPDTVGGMHMAQLITKPEVVEFLDVLTGISHSGLKLEAIHFNELRQEFKNKSIIDLDIRRKTGATIIPENSLGTFY